MIKRLSLIIFITLALAGCLHAQLNGSVAGATISISPLRDANTVLTNSTSADEADNIVLYGEENWLSYNSLVQHWLYGVFFVDGTSLQNDTLYLVTASGGVDTDFDRNQFADSPSRSVSHDWRAIMTGTQLLEVGYKVSALTEAAYRLVEDDIDQLSDDALLQRLDEIAVSAVADTNETGSVNHADLAYWTRLLEAENSFRGDFSALNSLSEALVNGATESELDQLAASALGQSASASYWKQVVADIDDKTYATAEFLYDQVPDPDFCVAGSLSQAAKDRALEAVNQIRALHGLPSVAYSSNYDTAQQEAALVQNANNYLTHFPGVSDNCFTQAAAEASASSNLTGGSAILDPVEDLLGHIDDSRNLSLLAAAGHRRTTLNPFMTYTSYGQVEGRSAQRGFGFDLEREVTPNIQVDYVAFPYETYPFLFVSSDPGFPTPWSFTVIEDKSSKFGNQHDYFSNATITVVRIDDGASLAVSEQYSDTDGFGVPNFLSWQIADWQVDTLYQVTISNVAMASGATEDFSYEVFIDYAALVDLTEPLETGDGQSGNRLVGTIADEDDADSYTLELGGSVQFNGSSQFSNMGYYILVYGEDKQLVNGLDDSFTLELDQGQYTVVVSNCMEATCYIIDQATEYQVTIIEE